MDYRDLPYDAEIEYLGLDRNQRYSIITNISQARGIGFGCELSHFVATLSTAGSGYPYLVGFNRGNPDRGQFYIKGTNSYGSYATGAINLDWQSAYHRLDIVISGDNRQKIELKSRSSSKMGVYFNGTFKYEYNKFVPSSAGVLSLLNTGQIYEGRIYRLFAYDENNDFLLDAIPVRVGNIGYLFDKVSGQLFGNSTTGSFILGPDVGPGRYANEVAFLESWGNQYIDTGIMPSTDTKIELKCLYCKSGAGLTNYGALIGADDRNNAYILNHSAVANFTYGIEFSNNFANPQTRLLTFNSTASPQNMRVYDEGGSLVTTLTCIRGVFEVNQNLYLFAVNRNGTPVYGSNRIMYCKIYDGNTLVRDYVPVEYNGTGYMYDKVSGLFFNNQGTGKFLFGSIAKACARSYTRRQLMAKAPEEDWSKHYLTFKVLSEGTITIVTTVVAQAKTIQYSVDNGSTWTSITSSTTAQSLGDFSAGDEILIKGNNSAYSNHVNNYNHFGGTAKVELRGNIMSLTYGDNFDGKTSYSASFAICGLFYSYANLVSAKKLVLPATTLMDRCYLNLFRSCTALKEPPAVLPATVCKDLCYQGMFQGCSSLLYIPYFKVSTMAKDCFNTMFSGCRSITDLSKLEISSTANTCCINMFTNCTSLTTKVPKLSAKTLASNCYGYMFDGCSNLTIAPDLPALTLVSNCYQRMFRKCSKLKYIKAMFTTTPSTSYTNVWVSGVPSGGTFVKNSAATWDVRGTSGIPSGWTVQTADE